MASILMNSISTNNLDKLPKILEETTEDTQRCFRTRGVR